MNKSQQQKIIRDPPEISWKTQLGPPNGIPINEDTKNLLKTCLDVSMPSPTTLPELVKQSESFPVSFPINTGRCSTLRDRGIEPNILEVRDSIHFSHIYNN